MDPDRWTECRRAAQYLSPQTTISLADELGLIPAEHKAAVCREHIHRYPTSLTSLQCQDCV